MEMSSFSQKKSDTTSFEAARVEKASSNKQKKKAAKNKEPVEGVADTAEQLQRELELFANDDDEDEATGLINTDFSEAQNAEGEDDIEDYENYFQKY